MTNRTVHVRIEGRVQGVGYRAWTEATAADLSLRGWVRNRRDGTVEAIFSGPPDPIADMLERCKTGPRHARVDAVVAHDRPEPADLPRAFEFRPTTE